MIKKIILVSAIILWCGAIIAQEKKVAVFDPAGEVTSSIKEIVREEISAVIVNAEGYTVLERQLINKVMEENKFQMGGLVDDSQISEIGKRMGANYVFVSSITSLDGNYYISFKMIEVQTARIEKQKTAQTRKGTTDIIEITQALVRNMFNEIATGGKQALGVENPLSLNIILVADGLKVFSNGKVLNRNEVRTLMANTDALSYYNKGMQRVKTSNILFYTSGVFFIPGIILVGVYHGDELLVTEASLILGAGAGFVVSGIVVRSKAAKDISHAVDMYNNRKSTSHVDWNFGVMPNGVSFTLKF
jgi:hypothetical protein